MYFKVYPNVALNGFHKTIAMFSIHFQDDAENT